MPEKKIIKHYKKPVSDIGKNVPQNLRFGIIVAIAIFWAQAFRTFIDKYVTLAFSESPLFVDITVALIVTVVGYFVLAGWSKITRRLNKVKVPTNIKKI